MSVVLHLICKEKLLFWYSVARFCGVSQNFTEVVRILQCDVKFCSSRKIVGSSNDSDGVFCRCCLQMSVFLVFV